MKVSVIVPTYERSELITRAIDSIFAQTWKDIEVIVIDDNIPDSMWQKKTRERLKKYNIYSNFVYLTTSGKIGGGAARNLGIRHATGEYITFLDDDDRFLPEKIEKQLAFMLEHGLDLSYQDVKWVDSQENLVEYRKMDFTKNFSRESLLKQHILHSICPTAIYMIKREKLSETEGFGEVRSGQDFILMLRCIESGMKIAYMPGVYVIQYLHNGKRISLGNNKIKGENGLYELKHQYFYLLSPKEQKYVKFRHYAVLSFACMRSHKPFQAAKYGLCTILIAPKFCVKEGIRYFGSKREK